MLAEVILSGWPLVVIICVGILGFVAVINGNWPWQGIVVHHDCNCEEEEEE